jgi:hypothetical protein
MRQKKYQGVAQALAPGPRIPKGRELCAIHNANGMIALLFLTPIELKRKKGRPIDVRGPLEPIGVLPGG